VAVFEGAAQPAVDGAGASSGADRFAVALPPGLEGGVAEQVSAFGIGEQRAQVQCGGSVLDVEVHHHGGVLTVRAASGLAVPAGFDQAHERIGGIGQRGPLR
jgi:hypothetical protein